MSLRCKDHPGRLHDLTVMCGSIDGQNPVVKTVSHIRARAVGVQSAQWELIIGADRLLQVVSAAHAVVLASGTLAPVEALSRQLFPGPAAAARIRHFSCAHVVSRDRLLAVAIGGC